MSAGGMFGVENKAQRQRAISTTNMPVAGVDSITQ
jgi:hypothetical protein